MTKRSAARAGDSKSTTVRASHDDIVSELITGYVVAVGKEAFQALYEVISERLPTGSALSDQDRLRVESLALRVQGAALKVLVTLLVDRRFRESLHADRARSIAQKKSLRSKPLNDAIDAAIRRGGPKPSAKEIIKLLVTVGSLTERADGMYVDAHTGRTLAHPTLVSRISRRRG